MEDAKHEYGRDIQHCNGDVDDAGADDNNVDVGVLPKSAYLINFALTSHLLSSS